MDTTQEPAGPEPLRSLFPELRDLPRQAKNRAPLPGLEWSVLRQRLGPIFFFAGFTALALIGIAVATLVTSSEQQKLWAPVTGKVVSLENVPAYEVSDGTLLRYTYTVQGKAYRKVVFDPGGKQTAGKWVGAPLYLDYLKTDPKTDRPHAATDDSPLWFFVLVPPMILGVMFLFSAPYWFVPLKTLMLARRIWKKAILAQGTIVFVRAGRINATSNPISGSEVIFRFEDISGRTHTGKVQVDNTWLVNQFAPETEVVVAYDPNKPERNVILEPFVG